MTTTTTTAPSAPLLARVADLLGLLEGVKPSMDADSKANQIIKAAEDVRTLLAVPPAPLVLAMNTDLEAVLSRTSFQAANIARTLRAGGQVIPKDNDAEVAASTLFLLNRYFAAGPDWQEAAHNALERMRQEQAERAPLEGDGGVLEGTNRTTSGAIGQP